MDKGQIVLFQTQGGDTKVEVRLANESVWLTADQMAELFQLNKSTVSRHMKNVFESGELEQDRTVAFLQLFKVKVTEKGVSSVLYSERVYF